MSEAVIRRICDFDFECHLQLPKPHQLEIDGHTVWTVRSAYTEDEARENLLYTLCIYYTLDSTGRWTLRQSSQAVTSRRWSISTAFTYKKRLPARHGCTFSWSSCTAAGGKTNTPSGSTYGEDMAVKGDWVWQLVVEMLLIGWVVSVRKRQLIKRNRIIDQVTERDKKKYGKGQN